MSDRSSGPDLDRAVEASLSASSFPERDWERQARAIEARLAKSVRGSTDARLLSAPLPVEPGEPAAASATATPLANSGVRPQSLADIARRSVEKKQASEREMARASLAIAAQQRPRREEAEARTDPAQPKPKSVEVSPAATAALVPNDGPLQPRRVLEPSPRSLTLKASVGIAALAVAAAALISLGRAQPSAPESAQTARAVVPASTPRASARQSPSAAEQAEPRAVDPGARAAEAAPARPDALALSAASSRPHASPSPSAQSGKVMASESRPALAAVPPTLRNQAAAKPAGQALPADPELRPADSTGAELSARPSTGAVQAALGAVMSGARRCVAGDAAASSAVVVFGSDGRVQGVTVTGPAAGKSSGACIEAQLRRARVQPFAAANFSVNATVRPD